MEEVKLNVFGQVITIMPKAQLVRLFKIDNDTVQLRNEAQPGKLYIIPINVQKKYGKTADEFISEFGLQQYKACENIN